VGSEIGGGSGNRELECFQRIGSLTKEQKILHGVVLTTDLSNNTNLREKYGSVRSWPVGEWRPVKGTKREADTNRQRFGQRT